MASEMKAEVSTGAMVDSQEEEAVEGEEEGMEAVTLPVQTVRKALNFAGS